MMVAMMILMKLRKKDDGNQHEKGEEPRTLTDCEQKAEARRRAAQKNSNACFAALLLRWCLRNTC